MSWDAEYEDPAAVSLPKVRVIIGRQALKIRDQDNILVASWAFRDLQSLADCRAGQPVVLGCAVSPHARLTVLDSSFGGELAPFAPHAIRLAGGRSSFSLVMVLGIIALLSLGGVVGWWLWKTIDVTLNRPAADSRNEVVFALPNVCVSANPGNGGQKALDDLARRIANGGGLSEIPTVRLLHHAVPLSFPAPDGTVYLTQGLVNRLQSAQELGGVIAHEFGHLAQGNHLATLKPLKLDSQDVVIGCQSETKELEADAWALRALDRAGFDTSGLASFAGRLPQGMSGPWAKMLCAHPVTIERLRTLRMDAPDRGRAPLSGKEWLAIRSLCDSAE